MQLYSAAERKHMKDDGENKYGIYGAGAGTKLFHNIQTRENDESKSDKGIS